MRTISLKLKGIDLKGGAFKLRESDVLPVMLYLSTDKLVNLYSLTVLNCLSRNIVIFGGNKHPLSMNCMWILLNSSD